MESKKKENILNKVKEFFSSHNIDADVVAKNEKFETVLLQDGVTEVTVEPALEVGAKIVLTASDGTVVPAEPNEYPLQDGRVIVVNEAGIVAEIRETAPESEEPMAGDAPSKAEEVKRVIERIETEKIFSRLKDLEGKVSDLEKTNKFLKEENEVLKKELVETKQFTKETFETLLDEPSKEPVVKNKFQVATDESALDAWMKKFAIEE